MKSSINRKKYSTGSSIKSEDNTLEKKTLWFAMKAKQIHFQGESEGLSGRERGGERDIERERERERERGE